MFQQIMNDINTLRDNDVQLKCSVTNPADYKVNALQDDTIQDINRDDIQTAEENISKDSSTSKLTDTYDEASAISVLMKKVSLSFPKEATESVRTSQQTSEMDYEHSCLDISQSIQTEETNRTSVLEEKDLKEKGGTAVTKDENLRRYTFNDGIKELFSLLPKSNYKKRHRGTHLTKCDKLEYAVEYIKMLKKSQRRLRVRQAIENAINQQILKRITLLDLKMKMLEIQRRQVNCV